MRKSSAYFVHRLAEIKGKAAHLEAAAPQRPPNRGHGRIPPVWVGRMTTMCIYALDDAIRAAERGNETDAWDAFKRMRAYLNDCFKAYQ